MNTSFMSFFENFSSKYGLYLEKSPNYIIDTVYEVSQALRCEVWSSSHEELSERLSFLINVRKKIKLNYDHSWKESKESKIAEGINLYTILLLLLRSHEELVIKNEPVEKVLRRLNAILKVIDQVPEHLEETLEIKKKLQEILSELFQSLPKTNRSDQLEIVNLDYEKTDLKVVPITILYSEGPIARAYLEVFRMLGVRPKKIIHLISKVNLSTKKEFSRFLPNKIKIRLAAFSQEQKMCHWSRYIKNKFPELRKAILNTVSSEMNFPFEYLSCATDKLNLSDYCDNIEPIFVKGVRDQDLNTKLSGNIEGVVLFTGGGIVPSSLLDIPSLRFIHIHPGYLPNVRGADCLLWSNLLYGRASASCFYMAPGIDTGDVIFSRWCPVLNIQLKPDEYDLKTVYRALYGFLDPWVRAAVLREYLVSMVNSTRHSVLKQDESHGFTYNFMHSKLQKSAIRDLFSE